jgi:hypothetical protein
MRRRQTATAKAAAYLSFHEKHFQRVSGLHIENWLK